MLLGHNTYDACAHKSIVSLVIIYCAKWRGTGGGHRELSPHGAQPKGGLRIASWASNTFTAAAYLLNDGGRGSDRGQSEKERGRERSEKQLGKEKSERAI